MGSNKVVVNPGTGVLSQRRARPRPNASTLPSAASASSLNIEGVQFHPESILTEQGHELFANFLKQTGGTR